MAILKINDTDVAGLGLEVVSVDHVWSRPRRNWEQTPLVGRLHVLRSLNYTSQAKVLRIVLALRSTVAARRVALDNVFWLFRGEVSLEWGDATDRLQYGYVTAADVRERFGQGGYGWVDGQLAITLEVALFSPLSVAKTETQMPLNAAGGCPLGTAISYPLITIAGALASDVTLTYKDSDGNTLSTLLITNPAIGAGTDLVVDCARERIWTVTGGTYTDKMELYQSGTFPVLDPADGDPLADPEEWPKLDSTATGVADYYKMWE